MASQMYLVNAKSKLAAEQSQTTMLTPCDGSSLGSKRLCELGEDGNVDSASDSLACIVSRSIANSDSVINPE